MKKKQIEWTGRMFITTADEPDPRILFLPKLPVKNFFRRVLTIGKANPRLPY